MVRIRLAFTPKAFCVTSASDGLGSRPYSALLITSVVSPDRLTARSIFSSSFDTSGLGVDELKTTLNYIEAPLLGRYELSPGAQLQPFVYAGGAAALYLGGEFEVDGETQDVDDDNVATIDLGFVIGAGAEMAAGTTTLIFDLRYTHGLIDLDTIDPDENGGVDFITKSRVISLFGGVLF